MITAFALKGLSEIKFKQFFSDYINPLYFCSLEAESVSHFFLHFHCFSVIQTTLVSELSLVDPEVLILNEKVMKKWNSYCMVAPGLRYE